MRLGNIELRHLRYFLAVAEQRSFRAAAMQLHISQPPLTRQIRQLEDELDVQLFIRQPRGVELTQAGSVLAVEAANLLTLTEQAFERTRLAGSGQLGRLDIGIFGSAVLGVIPQLVLRFRERYPNVEVVMHNMDRAAQIQALRERRLDVGFNRFFATEPDLTWNIVRSERMMVALHSGHALADREELALSDLAGAPMILYPHRARYGRGFNERVRELFAEREIDAHIVQEVDDAVTAVSLVSSGFGCCLVVESATALQLPGVRYIPLTSDAPTNFELCMIHRSDDQSALLEAFRSVVLETVRGA